MRVRSKLCWRTFIEIKDKNSNYNDYHILQFNKSIYDIEIQLNNLFIEGKINSMEKIYIMGLIISDAMHTSTKEFWRN